MSRTEIKQLYLFELARRPALYKHFNEFHRAMFFAALWRE